MQEWDRWGRGHLRDGDLVFRLGDTRILWGYFPLSWFIARATGSRFSHVGLVAVEAERAGRLPGRLARRPAAAVPRLDAG